MSVGVMGSVCKRGGFFTRGLEAFAVFKGSLLSDFVPVFG
jgi:hypothetical protein